VKPNINSVEVHPHLSNNSHPVDGVMVGAGSLWPLLWAYFFGIILWSLGDILSIGGQSPLKTCSLMGSNIPLFEIDVGK
jgi:hypothetical protein